MAFLPTKILQFTMSSPVPVANFSGTDDGWLGYPYRWSAFLLIVPQQHGSRETPTPYFYTGNDVNVGDYIVTSGAGRILKIVSISNKTSTSVTCVVEDENRENILSDVTTSGDGGIPAGEGLLFAVKNGWPILHPLPDALAGTLPPYFAANIIARFLNNKTGAPDAHASTHATGGSDPLTPSAIGAAPAANPTFTGVVTVAAGSAGAPAIVSGTGTIDTGLFFPLADTWAVSTAGTERLRVRSDGNIGIGVSGGSNAGIWLQPTLAVTADRYGLYARVVGAAPSTSPIFATAAFAELQAAATTSLAVSFYAVNPVLGVGASVTTAVGLRVPATFITGATNYGVQSSIPSGTNRWNLYADGTAQNYFAGVCQFSVGAVATPSLTFIGDENTGIFHPAADTIAVSTGGVETLRVDSGGRLILGPGSSTAGMTLDKGVFLSHPSGSIGYSLYVVNGTNNRRATFFLEDSTALFGVDGTATTGAPAFVIRTGGTERLRVDTTGNVGIGGTPNSGRRLTVQGIGIGDGSVLLKSSSTAAGASAGFLLQCYGTTSTAYVWQFETQPIIFGTANTERMRIESDGRVVVGTTGSTNHLKLFSSGGLSMTPSVQTGGNATMLPRTHLNAATYMGQAAQHGILALKFPFASGTGVRFRIRGLDMISTANAELWSFDYGIYFSTGYMGSTRSFHYSGLTPFSRVRILVSNGEYFLALGDTNTLWQFPHLVADVDFFYSGANVNANSLQWVAVTDDTAYTLYSSVHDITIDNVYPATGNIGIGIRTPTAPLSISRAVSTVMQNLRPSSTGAGSTKVSGNDQELLYTLGTTGAASAGAILQHRSYEPAALESGATWTSSAVGANNGICENGAAVAINAAGDRVIVGSPKATVSTSLTRCGLARVFQYDAGYNGWYAVGANINGEANNDQAGTSVAMSASGDLVAVGAPFNAGGGADAGNVRVYEYAVPAQNAALAWTQRGADINGAAGERSGTSISMSTAGNLVAIGGPNYSTTLANVGRVRVFYWDTATSAWLQQGGDIVGTAANTYFGTTVCLNGNGDRLAVFDFGGTNDVGQVKTYAWNGTTWASLGQTLTGVTANSEFGRGLAFDSAGIRLAVGAPKDATAGVNQGATRIYDWNSTTLLWELNTPVIAGEAAYDQSGYSVSLSADGDKLAVGAPLNAGAGAAGSNRGHMRIWTNPSGSTWTQLGVDLNGEANGDQYGMAVAISGTGATAVVGAPFYDFNVSVSFQNAANTVTRSLHNFINGDPITFTNIGTATGIAVNTTYYVINATTNTFQLAAALGGTTPIDITADSTTGTATTFSSGRFYTLTLSLGSQISRNQIRMADGGVSIENGSSVSAVYVDTVNSRVSLGAGTAPTARLDISADTVRLRTARTPASATAVGNTGDICWDANYVYVCVATNTWRRAALTTW